MQVRDERMKTLRFILFCAALAGFMLLFSGCSTPREAYNPTDAQEDEQADRVHELRIQHGP